MAFMPLTEHAVLAFLMPLADEVMNRLNLPLTAAGTVISQAPQLWTRQSGSPICANAAQLTGVRVMFRSRGISSEALRMSHGGGEKRGRKTIGLSGIVISVCNHCDVCDRGTAHSRTHFVTFTPFFGSNLPAERLHARSHAT